MKQLQNKDLNFISASQVVKKNRKASSKKSFTAAFPIILAIAGLSVWLALQLQYKVLLNDEEKYTKEIDSISSGEVYRQAVEAEKRLNRLNVEYSNSSVIRNAMDSYPDISKDFFSAIKNCLSDRVVLSSYIYKSDEGKLTLTGSAIDIKETSEFVKRLRSTGRFLTVDYTGYRLNAGVFTGLDGETMAEGSYSFSITGILKGKDVDNRAG